ncbi:MAG: putative baseplate assembly protein [Gaiellales bacterium]
MTLPAPNLDDRRFQQLVDDTKRLVQQRCPGWTDHNVHDPGVTLIETFAYMTDQLLYRLNRVPDRVYVKFLELIGVRLFPPTAARTAVTFWLSAPLPEDVVVSAGAEVATPRSSGSEVISFTTTNELRVVSASRSRVASSIQEGEERDHTDALAGSNPAGFYPFDDVPKPGDHMLVGLTDPVPSCAVRLRLECEIEGVGVDPDDPPLVWEAYTDAGWVACDLDSDQTGGLNRAGEIVLHVPEGHVASLVLNQRAGWLRCRIVEAYEGQPAYSSSPRVRRCDSDTIGGTVEAVHAETIDGELLGLSEGVPAQRFSTERSPIVPGDGPRVLEVGGEHGWQEWSEVVHFADSGPGDDHFVVDAISGGVELGPAVRERDGSLTQRGAVPPKGSMLRLRSYRTGGGAAGNVTRGALSVLKASIPFVSRVENRRPARGGVDPEQMENARVRGPLLLRTGSRAVTAEDYEHLAREAAPDVARVRCVAAGEGAEAGGVRVLVVPAVPADDRLRFESLIPSESLVRTIAEHLDRRRVIGARVVVEPPAYQGVTIVAKVEASPTADPNRVQRESLQALYRYFHPVVGGPNGDGWPFGRQVHQGDVYSVLQRVRGVDLVEDVRLFAADPVTGERGKPQSRVEIDPNALVFSYGHQVLVEGAGGQAR